MIHNMLMQADINIKVKEYQFIYKETRAEAPTRVDKRHYGTQQEKPELASSWRAPWEALTLAWLKHNVL